MKRLAAALALVLAGMALGYALAIWLHPATPKESIIRVEVDPLNADPPRVLDSIPYAPNP